MPRHSRKHNSDKRRSSSLGQRVGIAPEEQQEKRSKSSSMEFESPKRGSQRRKPQRRNSVVKPRTNDGVSKPKSMPSLLPPATPTTEYKRNKSRRSMLKRISHTGSIRDIANSNSCSSSSNNNWNESRHSMTSKTHLSMSSKTHGSMGSFGSFGSMGSSLSRMRGSSFARLGPKQEHKEIGECRNEEFYYCETPIASTKKNKKPLLSRLTPSSLKRLSFTSKDKHEKNEDSHHQKLQRRRSKNKHEKNEDNQKPQRRRSSKKQIHLLDSPKLHKELLRRNERRGKRPSKINMISPPSLLSPQNNNKRDSSLNSSSTSFTQLMNSSFMNSSYHGNDFSNIEIPIEDDSSDSSSGFDFLATSMNSSVAPSHHLEDEEVALLLLRELDDMELWH